MHFMIGDRLGKWVIFKELGRGGMGRVYLAQEELTGRQAAIKVLSAELAQEVGFLQRFQREIEALSKLQHPNIVCFFESGCENGHYFYAMEYVDGVSLDQIIDERKRLHWSEVLAIALEVTPALRHVHDHGIIHRDIKPSNLLRTSGGVLKLTDFGIAKVFASPHLTSTGGIVGTAEFLSPEQAGGKIVGKRSDLYSLGCVLYMLLTGRPPFLGDTYVELLHKHRYGQFDRPQKYVPELPHEIDELICQLLEKDPDKRPRDAMVFLKQLESICAKVERQSHVTSADNRDAPTKAENRTDRISSHDLPDTMPSPSRAERAHDPDLHDGALARLFNRPTVLFALLLGCVGILVWGMWPLGQDALYWRGAKLMESESLYDMQRAWTEYLEPLESRYPDHPYKEEVAGFRRKWEAAKAPEPSEAQRFYQQGELLQKQGNAAAAQQVWRSLVDVFGEIDAEKEWVQRARRSLNELDKANQIQDRHKHARQALDRARELKQQGKHVEAERIWDGIEQLYRNDPSAAGLLQDVQKVRQK